MSAVPDVPNVTGIPEDFGHAYVTLVQLVGSISRNEVSQEIFAETVDQWRAGDCRGSATLAGAALRALRYELASKGVKEGPEAVSEHLPALSQVEGMLEGSPATRTRESGFSSTNEAAKIVEVALPEQLRDAMPNGRGFRMGELQIIFEPTQGPPHGHMSVSHPRRYPTYEELYRAARAPGGKQPNLWMWIPKPEEAQKLHSNTVHLYVMPPEELLG